jgi:hypothetical protein
MREENGVMRSMPAKQSDIIRDLWSIIIGTNGEGLIERFKEFVEDTKKRHDGLDARIAHIEEVLPTLRTHVEQEASDIETALKAHIERETERQADAKERIAERRISTRDWLMITIVALGVFIPTLISLLQRKP